MATATKLAQMVVTTIITVKKRMTMAATMVRTRTRINWPQTEVDSIQGNSAQQPVAAGGAHAPPLNWISEASVRFKVTCLPTFCAILERCNLLFRERGRSRHPHLHTNSHLSSGRGFFS